MKTMFTILPKEKILRPGMVKYIIKSYLFGVDGIIVPSAIVLDTVNRYGVNLEKRVIPTGIELDKFLRPEIQRLIVLNCGQALAFYLMKRCYFHYPALLRKKTSSQSSRA